MLPVVKLPLDRDRMRERNLLDDIDEIQLARSRAPEERFIAALALSQRARALRGANPEAPVLDWSEDLEEKARLRAPIAAAKR